MALNHRHAQEVDKINYSIHSHHMQESVWLISDKKQKQTLTSGMFTVASLTTPKQQQINKLHVPKRAQVTQPKTLKPFCSQDAGLFVNICPFLDSLELIQIQRTGNTQLPGDVLANAGELVRGLRDRNLLTGSPHNTMHKYLQGLLCRCHIFFLALAASFKIHTA